MAITSFLLLLLVSITVIATTVRCQTLIWSDEFDGAAGSRPNPMNWKYDIGGDGWGNKELEYYTNSRENSALDGQGNLLITARKVSPGDYDCWYGDCGYTSARLLTSGLFSAKYGRIEARIKLPYGKGVWPAFWALGTNIDKVDWPACGEIDVVELRGSDPDTVLGTIHGAGYSGDKGLSRSYSTADGSWLSGVFHVYSIDWTKNEISWSIDNQTYSSYTPADLKSGTKWAFDHQFFLLLNLAVGGLLDGAPNKRTPFPQSMVVDYVRVYSH